MHPRSSYPDSLSKEQGPDHRSTGIHGLGDGCQGMGEKVGDPRVTQRGSGDNVGMVQVAWDESVTWRKTKESGHRR